MDANYDIYVNYYIYFPNVCNYNNKYYKNQPQPIFYIVFILFII